MNTLEAIKQAYPDALKMEETGSHLVVQIEGRDFSIDKDGLPPEVLEIQKGRFVYSAKCKQVQARMAGVRQ